MSSPPDIRAVVLRTAGTNCDGEMVRAFTLAGAQTDLVHLDRVIAEPALLEAYDLIAFPGGFSYGDDVGAGRVFAVKVREHLFPALRAAHERDVPMIGVCNGFQVLVQAGLLPGSESHEEPGEPSVALAMNAGGRFIDDWPGVEYDAASPCIWTRGLAGLDPRMNLLPLASGEGRFVPASDDVMRTLETNHQIAVRYTSDINGSAGRVAGICDPTGRIFGLMPHPDRYLEWAHHPFWTRLSEDQKRGDPPGLRCFGNAVEAVAQGARPAIAS